MKRQSARLDREPRGAVEPGTESAGKADLNQAGPRKPVRPVSPTYLRNAAMHYLSQRAASTTMLRQTLDRRAKKRLGVKVLDGDVRAMIDAVIATLVGHGLVDDARFAETRATTLAARGHSKKRIAVGLGMKGIARETIATTEAAAVDDLAQARRTIERKRLGPFRRGPPSPETRRKDLAALARAGFSYAVAVAALDAAACE